MNGMWLSRKSFSYSREFGSVCGITDKSVNVQVLCVMFHYISKGGDGPCSVTKRRWSFIYHTSGQVLYINWYSRRLKPSSFLQYQGDFILKLLEKACENTVFILFILH